MSAYNVLITGKNSHIGNKIEKWLESDHSNTFKVVQLDVVTDEWEQFNFHGFDVVIHMAAIVHRPDCDDWELYKRVNAELPVCIANKAKAAGVKQFIFFSTMAVYGIGKVLTDEVIDANTVPNPTSFYGKSKYMAENSLKELDCDTFHISIVRPPNVYGENGTRGYIITFAKIVKRIPVLPVAYENVKQSMIYIDNLTELIRLLVISGRSGCFMPQDDGPVSTVRLISAIAEAQSKRIYKSRILGLFVKLFSFIPIIQKAYGGISYEESLSVFADMDYVVVPFEEGIKRCLGNN